MTSKTFILTPTAQNATHLPTDFTQLIYEALNSETMKIYFFITLYSSVRCRVDSQKMFVHLSSESVYTFIEEISWWHNTIPCFTLQRNK